MITIRLLLDYDEGPIWPNISNPYTFEKSSGVKKIDDDEIVNKISRQMSDMYDNYFEFNTHNVSCWFNSNKFKEEKNIMLDLLDKLKARLNEINDGTYIIIDDITKMYNT